VLPKKALIKDFAVEHAFPKIGPRKVLLNARRLDAEESRKEMILLTVQDVTRAEQDGP
jgi:hypothetical protein